MPISPVFAGIYPTHALRIHVFVRYESNTDLGPEGMEYDLAGHRSAVVRLPDRTLLVTNPDEPWGYAPEGGRWDRVYNLDPYSQDPAIRTNWVLMSAHHGMGSSGMRDTSWNPAGKVKLFGDSGGSQLKSGTTDYVDPKGGAVWMNQTCDVGVPLDVPPRFVDVHYPELMAPLIEIQKRHNELFLSRARKATPNRDGLTLLNCSHGQTLDQTYEWCRAVQDDRFGGWAVGSDGLQDYEQLRAAAIVTQEFDDWNGEGHIHLFGAMNVTRAPALAWMGKFIKNLTCDGVGWMDGVAYHRTKYLDISGAVYTRHFGYKARNERKALIGSASPCSCPVCEAIGGHWQVFSMPRATPGPNLQLLHELWMTQRTYDMWSHRAMNTRTLEEYKEWVTVSYMKGRDSAGARKALREVLLRVQYVHDLFTLGPRETTEKHKSKVISDLGASATGHMGTLFGKSSTLKDTFGGSYGLPSSRVSTLPHYLTLEEMRSFGLQTDDLLPGVADGAPYKGPAHKVNRYKKSAG